MWVYDTHDRQGVKRYWWDGEDDGEEGEKEEQGAQVKIRTPPQGCGQISVFCIYQGGPVPCHAMSWFHVPCHIFGVMGLFFDPRQNIFGVMGLFFGSLGQFLRISWQQKRCATSVRWFRRLYQAIWSHMDPFQTKSLQKYFPSTVPLQIQEQPSHRLVSVCLFLPWNMND